MSSLTTSPVPARRKRRVPVSDGSIHRFRAPATLGSPAAPDRGWWSPALLIAGVMLLTIFEGALRKWVFQSSGVFRYGAYFSKDLLFFFAAYLGWRRGRLYDTSWIAVCSAIVLLPSLGATLMSANPVGAFLSLRAYVLIPLCAYWSASLVRGFRDIERCAILIAVAAMGVAVLSMYQYSLPANHYLNRYATEGDDTHIVAMAGHVRATGTFAYISGMSMLVGICSWAGMLLLLPLSGRSQWTRVIGLCSLAAGFVCSATAMTRGGVVFFCVVVSGSCLLYFRPKQILAFLFVVLLVSPFISGGDEQISENATTPADSLTSGLTHRLTQENAFSSRASFVLQNFILGTTRHPLGEGLGIGQAGSRYFAGTEAKPYESEWGRIALEVGPLGLAAVLFIRFASCWRLWQRLSGLTDDRTRLVLACTLPYFGIMSLGWMAFNHSGNSFAWSVMALGLAAAANYGRRPRPNMQNVP